MRTLLSLFCLLVATPNLLLADGIPVDRETGKISVPHTLVNLNADQIEEIDALGTLTFTSEQWAIVRKVAPSCAKRLNSILPVTWSDCTCCVEYPYGIAVSRNAVAILHDEGNWDETGLAWNLWNDGKENGSLFLRVDQRGQFYHRGTLIPFSMLLEAIANKLEAFEEAPSNGEEDAGKPWVYVECPFGMDRSAATLKSRIDQLYRAAGSAGWETPDNT